MGILPHQDSPGFLYRHTEELVFSHIHRFHKEPQIKEPPFHPFFYIIHVSAVNLKPYQGIPAPEVSHQLRQPVHAACLAAANGNLPCQGILIMEKFHLCLFRKGNQLLGPAL